MFKVQTGERLHTFRRGTRRGTIRCLSFDITGRYLCVGSASGTIHFYKNTNGNGATNGNDGNNEHICQFVITKFSVKLLTGTLSIAAAIVMIASIEA